MSKSTKKYIIYCVIFCIIAITFSLLYAFDLIANLDLVLTGVYVSYFAGIALLYNGGYTREQNHIRSSLSNFILGFLFIGVSIGLLIYGIINGNILFF